MIITKKRFNMTPGYRGKWPFTVPEVTIEVIIDMDGKTALFGLVHRFGRFALSGALEPFGFSPLVDAGIWATETRKSPFNAPGEPPEYVVYNRSLTPFFAYIQAMAVRELGGKTDGKK